MAYRKIYVQTDIAGQAIWHSIISDFSGKPDLYTYVDEILSCTDDHALASDSISDLLEKLYDRGPGRGQRYHRRVSRKDAIEAIRAGATNQTVWL